MAANPRRLSLGLCIFLSVALLAEILYWHPFYGLMDDATNLFRILPELKEKGLFNAAWDYAKRDLEWGLLRPMNPWMVGLLYPWGVKFGPTALFLANAILVLGTLGYLSRVLGHILKLDPWMLFAATFAFPYTYDLFQHPSLQEKVIHLWGAVLLSWVYRGRSPYFKQGPMAQTIWYFGIVVITLLGALTKASFIVYMGISLYLLVIFAIRAPRSTQYRHWIALGLLLVMDLCIARILSAIGHHGRYQHSWSVLMMNFGNRYGLLWLAFSGLCLSTLVFKRFWKDQWEQAIPFMGGIGFALLYLPWTLMGYLFSLLAPFVAAAMVQALQLVETRLPKTSGKSLWLIAIAGFTCLSLRATTDLGRLSDLGRIVRSGPKLSDDGIHELWMPCREGSQAMALYFERFAVNANPLRVHILDPKENPDGKLIVYDSKMCKLPEGFRAQWPCQEEPVLPGSFRGSYGIFRQRCNSG